MKRSILFVLVVLATLGVAAPASAASPTIAYLDPATGTLIVSAIIGGFAAIGMFVKRFWYQIKGLFTGGKPTPAEVAPDPTATARGSENPAISD